MRRPIQLQPRHAWSLSTVWMLSCLVMLTPYLSLPVSNAVAETRQVTAGESLKASAAYRWIFGNNYRDVWSTPIEVDVLDLQTVGGGLRPVFRVGGLQNFDLVLFGANGRSYTFRSSFKDLSQVLPEEFKGYAVSDIVQDQISATHPAAPLIVPPLAAAAGILHTEPRLVMMPDDPALGQFRELFAGRLGTFEEFPTAASDKYPGFYGAAEILSSKQLWPRLLAGPENRVDVRAFLRARLFDFLIGDWNRHAKQWRWAKLSDKAGWQPIPEDRDAAFSSYEGALVTLFRPFKPLLVTFREDYPSRTGLTIQGWQIHRWLLPELDKSTWQEMAADLKRRMTDAVIEAAVNRMPGPYYALHGAEMVRRLKQRRDRLPEIATRVYEFLASEVDVRGTNQNEHVELRALPNGDIDVSISHQSASGPKAGPYFHRRFHPTETRSLRIYLHQGDDQLTCQGHIGSQIDIFVIGNTERDVLIGCETAKLRFLDTAEAQRRQRPIRLKPSPLKQLKSTDDEPAPWFKPRDWRHRILPIYLMSFGTEHALLVGGGLTLDQFEFGKAPAAQRHTLKASYSVGRNAFEALYEGAYQHWNPALLSALEIGVSGLERTRFYGFGNETSDTGPNRFFETEQLRYHLRPTLRYAVTPQLDLFIGGQLKYTSTDMDDNSLLNQLQPYGGDDFGQIGVRAGAVFDTRDRTKVYGPGMRLRLLGTLYPAVWDVDTAFSAIEGEIVGYIPLSHRLLLAARIGGKKVFGTVPFHEAAYVGGGATVRGYHVNRFAGDASVFANAELRYSLGNASAFLFRAEWGFFVFSDVGRVFLDGESSDKLHPSAGAGLSASTLKRSVLWSFSMAFSEERTDFIFKADFSF